MIKKLLNLDYEKRIDFMERNCVNGKECINKNNQKCVDCWDKKFNEEFNKVM